MPSFWEMILFILAHIAIIAGFIALFLTLQFFSVVGGLIAERWRNS